MVMALRSSSTVAAPEKRHKNHHQHSPVDVCTVVYTEQPGSDNEIETKLDREDPSAGAPVQQPKVPISSPQQKGFDKKRRRSARNTNKLRLSDRSSLQYRRLEELFFDEAPTMPCQQLQLGSFQLTRVCQSPNIWLVPDFLNATELHYLHTVASTLRFQRSYVDPIAAASPNSNKTDSNNSSSSRSAAHIYDAEHRTSTFLSFQKQQDATISRIEAKAAALLGCWGTQSIEPLQLVRYTRGQFFGIHHDMGDYHEETGTVALPPKSWCSQRRLVTLFCYLNPVPRGGATHFPIPNVRVDPVPGRAVLFANVRSNGQPDPRTIHAGEAVQEGTKYGLNIWICED